MGKAALLALGVLVMTEAYQNRNQLGFSSSAASSVSTSQGEALARNAATAGFEVARERITRPTNFISVCAPSGSFSGSTSGAAFQGRTTTALDCSSARLNVEGRHRNADGTTSYYVATGQFQRKAVYTTGNNVPTFLQYGLITEQSLSMNGNILIDTMAQGLFTEGERSNQSNANIHTNGSLTVTGNAALIRGFGTYVSSGSGRETLFRPYYNPTNAATLRRVNRVDIPFSSFTPQAIATQEGTDSLTVPATGTQHTLTGTYNFVKVKNGVQVGTRSNPFVWHIRGNVTISGSATFNGYVMFLIDGNLDMGGNAVGGYGTTKAESHVAWYVGNNITMRGNSSLWGQFFARNQVSFSGTPRIYGSITANAATISGTPKIYFQEASAALTNYWQTPTYQMELISYLERPAQTTSF